MGNHELVSRAKETSEGLSLATLEKRAIGGSVQVTSPREGQCSDPGKHTSPCSILGPWPRKGRGRCYQRSDLGASPVENHGTLPDDGNHLSVGGHICTALQATPLQISGACAELLDPTPVDAPPVKAKIVDPEKVLSSKDRDLFGEINGILFDPTGFSDEPREPEELGEADLATLSEMFTRRTRLSGRPCKIPGTLAQVIRVSMLLDTGAACCLMPHALFREVNRLKPSLKLTPSRASLCGISGTPLEIRGMTTMDVEINGQYVLVQFAVAEHVDEVVLGMDFLRENAVGWNLPTGELILQGGRTVFAQRAVVVNTAQPVTHRVRLAKPVQVPANSLVWASVSVTKKGHLPTWGAVSAVRETVRKYGVLAGRAILDPHDPSPLVPMMNPTESTVILPTGMVVGTLEPIYGANGVKDVDASRLCRVNGQSVTGKIDETISHGSGSESSDPSIVGACRKGPTGLSPESGDANPGSVMNAPPSIVRAVADELGIDQASVEREIAGCGLSPSNLGTTSASREATGTLPRTQPVARTYGIPHPRARLWHPNAFFCGESAWHDPDFPEAVSEEGRIKIAQAGTLARDTPVTAGGNLSDNREHDSVGAEEPELSDDDNGSLPEHMRPLFDTTKGLLDVRESRLLKTVLRRNADIFARSSTDLGSTNVTTHRIDTGDSMPIKQQPRRVPIHKQKIIREKVQEMLDKGIIEPSTGSWSSPIVLATKKDGSMRFCIDYRKLNEATRKDAYPLPRIEDNLDTLRGAQWFSTLDLISGYWQVEMDPLDKPKTAFSVGRGGLYQFLRMPFGLCNAPATFERLMEKVLAGLVWEIAVLYIDDIVVIGSTVDEHLDRLEMVFDRIRKAGMKLKPSKCDLLKKKVEFLGHIVSAEGVEPDPGKIRKVVEWPAPKDLHELRSFIGLCTYYRRFVEGFSTICKPLYILTEKSREWQWGPEQEDAFQILKRALTTAPILAYPNERDPFVLDTDASNFGIGGVLSQVQNGVERVIAYGSRLLNKPERNYCVTRRELLAIVEFVRQFHHYLVGKRFLLRTDHAALYWLFGMKELEGQNARWVERLNTYDMVIQHRPGKKHLNADALSRCPPRCAQVEREETDFRTGAEIPLEEFVTISHYYYADNPDLWVPDESDEEWSEGEWEEDVDSSPILQFETAHQIDDQMDLIKIRRVTTRAQARAEAEAQAMGTDEPDTQNGNGGIVPPTAQEIVDLQNQQMFLEKAPPVDWSNDAIALMQRRDKEVSRLIDWVDRGERPTWQEIAKESGALKNWWARWDQLVLSENGVLYLRWVFDSSLAKCPELRIVTPYALQRYVLKELHDAKTAGHLGMRKTRLRVYKSRFFWPAMGSAASRWVRNCLKCGARKHPQYSKRAGMQTYRVGAPMDRVSIDILGPFKPRTARGNFNILTITDQFTRWCEAFPLKEATGLAIARRIVQFIGRNGVPREILSDQGSNVDGQIVHEVCRLLGCDKMRCVSYHPESNSITERENKVIADMLSHYINKRHSDWDDVLDVVMLAYRTSVHRTLGETPAAMMFGRELRLPMDAMVGPPPEDGHEIVASSPYVQNLQEALQVAYELVRERVAQHHRYEKVMYDRHAVKWEYHVGQAVWLRHFHKTTTKSKKLMRPYTGPHIVKKRVGDVVYLVTLQKGKETCVHGNRLKPFYGVVDDPYLAKLWRPREPNLRERDVGPLG